ncbi:MAG: alkaline phosphatase family protein [Thermoleophilia bacterium]
MNTIQPAYQPYQPGTAATKRLPAQTAPTIGDRLSAAGVSWAWYSGGWSNADGDIGAPGWTNGTQAGATCTDPGTISGAVFPNCPAKLFQFHHQPLNYFASFAPGTPARAEHLRDETEFLAAAGASGKHCDLRQVSFVKPLGNENEHPGYSSEAAGSTHLVNLLKAIEGGACAKDTMVVVTYDEFGGQWDHVPPPGQGGTPGAHDAWGPGTRIPALVLAPGLHGAGVDHTTYDTTSVLATIEDRFGLAPLTSRDAAVSALGGVYHAQPIGGHGS